MSTVSFACPSCRAELVPGALNCPACGAPIGVGENPFAAPTVTVSSAASVSDSSPAPDSGTWAGLLSAPLGADEIGRLGPYRILDQLGAGGMGMVFNAQDIHLQRLGWIGQSHRTNTPFLGDGRPIIGIFGKDQRNDVGVCSIGLYFVGDKPADSK